MRISVRRYSFDRANEKMGWTRGDGICYLRYTKSRVARRHLLVRLAIVFHPARDMPSFRVMVCPMDGPALLAPEIFAVKADVVAFLESVNSRGDVDVVCHEHCLSRCKTNDESLVSWPVQIIWQNTNHGALAFDLYVANPTFERMTDGVVIGNRYTSFSERAWSTT